MRLGRFQLTQRIAQGGMAEIFIAQETGLAGFRRAAVVKRILPDLSQNEEFVQLFLDEARLAAQLSHPNIVHIYELGHDDGSYYIAMEYIPGLDLESLLTALGGPMPLADALHIISDVLEGLHFAHTLCDADGVSVGVVHRDVSPKNVLLSRAGAVKIVDFGIAKARTKVSVTMPGRVMGTVGYMSPEQAKGKSVDLRSDVFSTGAMLYRMTTGVAPFKQRPFYRSGSVSRGEFLPPREVRPDLPQEVERIIVTAMSDDPSDRYASAAQMRRQVTALSLRLGVTTDPVLLGGLVRSFMPSQKAGEEEPSSLEQKSAAASGHGEPDSEASAALPPIDASLGQDLTEEQLGPPAMRGGTGEVPSTASWDLQNNPLGLDFPLTRDLDPEPRSVEIEFPDEDDEPDQEESSWGVLVDEPVRDTLVDGVDQAEVLGLLQAGEPTIDEASAEMRPEAGEYDGEEDTTMESQTVVPSGSNTLADEEGSKGGGA